MKFLTALIIFLALMTAGANADARCTCYCVNGSSVQVCDGNGPDIPAICPIICAGN